LDSEIQEHEKSENDIQWSRIVELEIIPHPKQPYPETIALEYSTTNLVLQISGRAAIVGYLLRRWNNDYSYDASLEGPEFFIWLKNAPASYGVSTNLFAPGYKEP